MALAGSSILVTPGSGVSLASQTVSSKEHQVAMLADADGHVQGSTPVYQMFQMPRVTTAAATDFFDIFNAAASGKIVRLRGLWPILEITAASAIIPTFRFDCFRTSAVGTGGTAHTYEGAAAPATGLIQIARLASRATTLSASVTARALPTGGATAAVYWFSSYLQSEETNPASTLMQGVNLFAQLPQEQPYELQAGEGMKVRQITATASTGTNFGWLLVFAVIP